MSRELALVIVLALLAWALFAVWRGWRARRSKYAHLPLLSDSAAVARSLFDVLYVATTEADNPMERVAVSPLAFRGRAQLGVEDDGVTVDVRSEGRAHIPSSVIEGAGVATWTIDKAVDPDGLVFLRWQWGELMVESFFRVVDHPRDEVIAELMSVVREDRGEGR